MTSKNRELLASLVSKELWFPSYLTTEINTNISNAVTLDIRIAALHENDSIDAVLPRIAMEISNNLNRAITDIVINGGCNDVNSPSYLSLCSGIRHQALFSFACDRVINIKFIDWLLNKCGDSSVIISGLDILTTQGHLYTEGNKSKWQFSSKVRTDLDTYGKLAVEGGNHTIIIVVNPANLVLKYSNIIDINGNAPLIRVSFHFDFTITDNTNCNIISNIPVINSKPYYYG